jgi:chemotaxis protein histidine kinase CheA
MPRRILRYLSLISLLFASLAALPAAAETGYTIRGVEVNASASDATIARVQAMEEGERAAFAQLLAQLIAEEEAAAKAAATPAHVISRMVRGYEVHDEKVGATSYAATFDVNFDAAQVNAFIRAPQAQPTVAGQPPVAAQPTAPAAPAAPRPAPVAARTQTAQNVLVLPVWVENADNPLLWESNNEWRAAWNNAERTDTQFIRLPIGDQSDRMVVDAPQALQGRFETFSPIAERYQSSTVVLAAAMPTVSSGVNALSVNLRRIERGGQISDTPLTYEQQSAESREEMMQRAAQDVIRRIMQEAQQRSLQQNQAAASPAAAPTNRPEAYAPRSRLTVLSRLERLNDWVNLRRRLMNLQAVEQVDLSAISNRQVDLVVHFRGSPVELEQQMQAAGMQVNKAPSYWIIGF